MSDHASPPDFFVLLGLDPHAPWDRTAFDRVIAAKRTLWMRISTMGIGKQKATAKANLALLPTIQRELINPITRAEHIRRPQAAKRAAARAAYDEMRETLDLLQAKGYLLASEVDALIARFPMVGASEIRSRIVVPVHNDATQTLDVATRKAIKHHLATLGRRDLYDFLSGEHGRLLQTRLLREIAHASYAHANLNVNKSDPIVHARQMLAGFALEIFRDEQHRVTYDNTLAAEVYDALEADVDALCQIASVITAEQVTRLIARAMSDNPAVDAAMARIRIVRRVHQVGILMEIPSLDAMPQPAQAVRLAIAPSSDKRLAISSFRAETTTEDAIVSTAIPKRLIIY